MIPYYVFFLFFGLGASLDFLKQNDYSLKVLKAGFFYFGFVYIVFFVGFRYKLASDWYSYIQFYDNAYPLDELLKGNNLDFSTDFLEPGFKILMAFSKGIGLNFFYFVFVITLFNSVSLFYFLTKKKIRNKLVFLSILLIITIFTEFDILRQSLAFHIILFAFTHRQLNFFPFIFYILLGMTFHLSAFIFLLYYLFQKLPISRFGISVLAFLYFISLFFTLPIITSIFKFITPLASGTLSSIVSKSIALIENFDFQRNISFTTLLNLGFMTLLSSRIKKLKLSDIELSLIKLFLFYILISVLFKEIKEIADRFSYYFTMGIAFMFALLPDLVNIREKKFLILPLPLLFIVMRLIASFKQPAILYGLTPYRNYFFRNGYDEQEIQSRYTIMQNIGSSENEKKAGN